jgi:hypothetical protein
MKDVHLFEFWTQTEKISDNAIKYLSFLKYMKHAMNEAHLFVSRLREKLYLLLLQSIKFLQFTVLPIGHNDPSSMINET